MTQMHKPRIIIFCSGVLSRWPHIEMDQTRVIWPCKLESLIPNYSSLLLHTSMSARLVLLLLSHRGSPLLQGAGRNFMPRPNTRLARNVNELKTPLVTPRA